jgi:hypothetical protein
MVYIKIIWYLVLNISLFIYLFEYIMIKLTELSVAETHTVEWWAELQRLWKEAFVAHFKVLPRHLLGGSEEYN